MPNHIHIVFKPIVERKAFFAQNKQSIKSLYVVTKIMQDYKKFTARKANKILNRTGKFWQHESFDHVVRDQKELLKIIEYILNNPAKAGLCISSDNWKWNYYNPEYLI